MSDILDIILTLLIVFGPSAAGIIWFIVSLVMFLRTEKGSPKYKGRKALLIVSACAASVIVSVTVAMIIIFFIGLAHM